MSFKDDLKTFFKQNEWDINKLKGTDVFYYVEENFKPNIHSSIAWHIENQKLEGVKNKYDQGWLDALEMVARYYDESGV